MKLQSTQTSQGAVNSWESNGIRPTVVLLPGNSINSHEFAKLFTTLGEQYHLVAIDYFPLKDQHNFKNTHPDQKLSAIQRSAYVALEVLNAHQIDLQNIVFLGHGLGANIAFQLAKWQEDGNGKVRGIITVGHALIHNTMEGITEGYNFPAEVQAALGKEELAESDAELFATAVGFDPSKEEERFAIEAALESDGAYRTDLFATYTRGLDERVFMQRTKIPALVLHGSKDSNMKIDYLHTVAGECQNMTVKVIEGAPQVCFWTHFNEVSDLIKEFVEHIN